ncbi:Hypothetical_protein [Hexamita inflata]|uniref:Hypothetical_protein n=1 Tax=Hexamita inflata TaxID=28002 RepID=A0AA86UJM0_9EUKA|nr:Hypothetical protein HINF_LOCUS45944 [Hexamita inflata]
MRQNGNNELQDCQDMSDEPQTLRLVYGRKIDEGDAVALIRGYVMMLLNDFIHKILTMFYNINQERGLINVGKLMKRMNLKQSQKTKGHCLQSHLSKLHKYSKNIKLKIAKNSGSLDYVASFYQLMFKMRTVN